MQRYDISGGFGMDQSFHPCDDGDYVFYSDAMAEIEKEKMDHANTCGVLGERIRQKDIEIEKLKAEVERFRKELNWWHYGPNGKPLDDKYPAREWAVTREDHECEYEMGHCVICGKGMCQ